MEPVDLFRFDTAYIFPKGSPFPVIEDVKVMEMMLEAVEVDGNKVSLKPLAVKFLEKPMSWEVANFQCPDFEALVGKTLTSIIVSERDEEVDFVCSDGERYRLYHSQDCCENVVLHDVCGDWADMLGSPILTAEEVSSDNDFKDPLEDDHYESHTWTFYKMSRCGTI